MKIFERLKTGSFILHRYVTRSYMSAFFLGLLLLTFVLSIGLLVRAARLVVMGLDPALLVDFFAVSMPELLSYTIPLAALVSALLVFGRLSSDGEVSAMRACGINIWSVMTPLIVFGAILAAVTTYINGYIAPRGNDERHIIQSKAHDSSTLKILQPGQYIKDFPGQTFWFASKEDNLLKDVRIYEHGRTNPDFTREIRAESAYVYFTNSVARDPATGAIVTNAHILLDMNTVRIEPISEHQPGILTAANIKHLIVDPSSTQTKKRRRKAAADTNDVLLSRIDELSVELAAVEDKYSEDSSTLEKVQSDLDVKCASLAKERNAFNAKLVASVRDASLSAIVTNAAVAMFITNSPPESLCSNQVFASFIAKATPSVFTTGIIPRSVADEETIRVCLRDAVIESFRTDLAPADCLASGEVALLDTLRSKVEKDEKALKEIRSDISERKTEFNRRWAFGLAPFAFILIGMPLGIRTSRKESNIGIAISLGIMLIYYAFVILGKSLSKHPELFPHILIWTPSVICALVAFMLIRKNQ